MVTPAEDRDAIRHAARKFVRERAPVAHLRAMRDAGDPLGYSRELWREMASLGFAGLTIPQRFGGGGLGFADQGVVLEELGRNLVPTPTLSATLGAGALALGGTDELRETILPRVCAGEQVVALADEEGTRYAPYAVATSAERQREGFVLRGEKSFVIDGQSADAFVVMARTSGKAGERDGLTLFLVTSGTPGVSTQRLDLVDSRNVARVRFESVRVGEREIVGIVNHGADVLDAVVVRGTAVLAAEMLGGQEEVFDRTLAYLKTRKQFGVYIGSFQALKHRAAWMFCELALTRSVVHEALQAIDAQREDARLLTSAAKARASDTYVLVANEAIQMHGGIGVTDELDVGLYLKRARVAEQTLGGAAYHVDRFARLQGY